MGMGEIEEGERGTEPRPSEKLPSAPAILSRSDVPAPVRTAPMANVGVS